FATVCCKVNSARERFGLVEVRGHHRRQREQTRHKRLDCIVLQEPRARARNHHRIDDQRNGMSLDVVGDRLDQLAREQHPRLPRVNADVVEHRVELRADELRRQRVHAGDRNGVLRRQGNEHRQPVTARSRERLQVRLDPCAPARIGRGDRQHAWNGHSSLRRYEPDQVRRVCSQPRRAPRSREATIALVTTARYDGLAEWYDREFADGGPGRLTVLELLGDGPGTLVDVGCGTGVHAATFAKRGWSVVGVDISDDLLARARERGVEVVNADAAALPFANESFDAAVSMWTHTDVDDFAAAVREIARVLRDDAVFVYLGAHPCFVGPHSEFVGAVVVPRLHAGHYRRAGRYVDAPGISPSGLRAEVGATHLPLGFFVQAFGDAGLRIDRFVEPEPEDR